MNAHDGRAQSERTRVTAPLFRPEVFAAGAASEEGEILLITPLSSRWLTLLAMAICAVLLLFLAVGQYAQKATFSGVLVANGKPTGVLAPRAGVVLQRRVGLGQSVRRGDVIYLLSLRRTGNDDRAIGSKQESRRTFPDAPHDDHARSEGQLAITAPIDGVVAGRLRETGEAVAAGALMLSIAPTTPPLHAQLYVPDGAVDFIKVGQSVQLRYQAFPYQTFDQQSGKILSISRERVPAQDLPTGVSTSAQRPLFRIDVALQEQTLNARGQAHPLVAGMTLQSEVSLAHRRLIEWIFDPIHG